MGGREKAGESGGGRSARVGTNEHTDRGGRETRENVRTSSMRGWIRIRGLTEALKRNQRRRPRTDARGIRTRDPLLKSAQEIPGSNPHKGSLAQIQGRKESFGSIWTDPGLSTWPSERPRSTRAPLCDKCAPPPQMRGAAGPGQTRYWGGMAGRGTCTLGASWRRSRTGS